MVSRVLSSLVAVRVTAAYAVMLVIVAATLLTLGPHAQSSAVSRMSTNLDNLAHGHLDTLVGSAFVTEDAQIYIWLPGLACLLASAELLWHSRRMLLAFACGHIGATLIVAVGLVAALQFHWLPVSITRASDVGISYGAMGVLGALTAAIPPRWRPAWIGWWLGIGLFDLVAAAADDFTTVGHVLALALGMALSTRFRSPARWTLLQMTVLAIGVSYGYLILAGSSLALPIAGLAAMSLVLITQRVFRRWLQRRALCRSDAVVCENLSVSPA
jgi:hypothetical protein